MITKVEINFETGDIKMESSVVGTSSRIIGIIFYLTVWPVVILGEMANALEKRITLWM